MHNLDFNIEHLRSATQLNAQTVNDLDRERADVSHALESLAQELEIVQSHAGWREKFLGGYLGGNQSAAQRLKEVKGSIHVTKSRLSAIDEKLKQENERLNKSLVDFLAKASSTFQKLQAETQLYHTLYSTSITYNGLLQDAHNKVSDALMLTSWESLLHHPQAQAGISAFRGTTIKYQRDVETANTALEIDLHQGKKLEDYIQFTSEAVALENFGKIQSQVRKNIAHAELKFKETRQSNLEFIKHCKTVLLESSS
jgi:hypothetical protein